VTGGANGMIYNWGGASLVKVNQTHPKNQAIHSIRTTAELILSGGRDNTIRISNH